MITGQSETVGARLSQEIDVLRPLPGLTVPDVGAEHAPRQPEVDDRGAPQPLLGPGPARRQRRSPPGSARARLTCSPTGGSSRRIRGCVAASCGPPGWITTSSCWSASPARSSTRSRCARSVSRAAGPSASTSCGSSCGSGWAPRRPPRQIVDVLMLCRDHDPKIVELAVRGALAAGAVDGRAVALLCDRKTRPPAGRDRAARPARPARPAHPRPGRIRPAARP